MLEATDIQNENKVDKLNVNKYLFIIILYLLNVHIKCSRNLYSGHIHHRATRDESYDI